MYQSSSQCIIKFLSNLNKVTIEEALQRGCHPFFVCNKQVGLIRPDQWKHLQTFKDVFVKVDEENKDGYNKPGVHLSAKFSNQEERTAVVNDVLEKLRKEDAVLALRGWRHENYKVSQRFGGETLLEIERAGAGLFGIISYGVHINGYTKNSKGEYSMWIGRRSKTKQTFPDMLDNMCAGGLAADLGITECARKECQEEASVSDELLKGLKFVGNISYFYEDERGLSPECQFVYDLEVPHDFKPINADGEVGSFEKLPMEEVMKYVTGGKFKPNCAAVCLDFMIRHGMANPDSDPNISYYIEQLHAPLQTYYTG